MIAKISRGWRIGGLVRYLMGPGRFNEHSDQRVVGSWDGDPASHQPQHTAGGGFDVADLAAALADPAVAAGIAQRTPPARPDGKVPRGPVWHCSLRNAAEDDPLSDDQWAEVVEDLMDRTGIARRGDEGGCRWVAIRHGGDHVHVAAMLVRQDNGRRVHPRHDYFRARDVCRDAEARLGLTETAPADQTAPEPYTRAEQEKAQRQGADEPTRVWLRRAARLAAVRGRDADGFFAQLRDLGVIVRPRPGPDGTPVGYAVAAPRDTDADGRPVFYGGGKLAGDLTLPKLRQRWASAPAPPAPMPPTAREKSRVGRRERDTAVDEATASIHAATAALRNHGGRSGSAGPSGAVPSRSIGNGADADDEEEADDGIAHAAADMLEAIGATTTDQRSALAQDLWRGVGDAYDRAARVPGSVVPRRWGPVAAALRQSAWRLAAIGRVGGRDAAAGQQLIVALAVLVAEVAALREQQRRTVQACAARRSWRRLTGTTQTAPSRPPSGPSRRAHRPDPNRPGRAPTGRRTGRDTGTAPMTRAQPPPVPPARAPGQHNHRPGRHRS